MLCPILRRVDWVPVGEKWSRLSIMGTDLSSAALQKESYGESDDRVAILMIPGNPGNEGFYADFGERLLRNLLAREKRTGEKKMKYLFYSMSHLNHISLPPELERAKGSSDMSDSDRFLLSHQVQHNLDFIHEHLPHANRVFVLGHSIGAFIALKVLPYIKDDFHIAKTICLFPTVERMADSPNGIRLRRLLAALAANDWLTKSLSFWMNWLPVAVKNWIVGVKLRGGSVPLCVKESTVELFKKNVVRNVVYLSNDELDTVSEFDFSLIETTTESIYFLYGTHDGWCPIQYGLDMTERMPPGHVIMDDKECEHAFVIRDGQIVADKLVSLIV